MAIGYGVPKISPRLPDVVDLMDGMDGVWCCASDKRPANEKPFAGRQTTDRRGNETRFRQLICYPWCAASMLVRVPLRFASNAAAASDQTTMSAPGRWIGDVGPARKGHPGG